MEKNGSKYQKLAEILEKLGQNLPISKNSRYSAKFKDIAFFSCEETHFVLQTPCFIVELNFKITSTKFVHSCVC
jgi:hypothetical protein